ncbi:hypothetical protein [Microbispora hainanensis]|uniref:Uncharacterized protein n=1 Tax=Microbispora hainanensis TaxID=568844 RepID=A0ABZ1SH86_9ACTN|nr:hypothetical protein [Microbispora hainanensis]
MRNRPPVSQMPHCTGHYPRPAVRLVSAANTGITAQAIKVTGRA